MTNISEIEFFVFTANKVNRTVWTYTKEGFDDFLKGLSLEKGEVEFANQDFIDDYYVLNNWLSNPPEGTKRFLVIKGIQIIPSKEEIMNYVWSIEE